MFKVTADPDKQHKSIFKVRYSIFLNGGVAKFILKEMMLVQSLSHIRLLATPGLQHTRLPMFRHLPEFAQTHIH